MEDNRSWDWSTRSKEIPLREWESRFNWVEEPCISPDGESVASIVNVDDMAFGICVNGALWEGEHEKAWSLKALPDNRFAACVCQDDEWGLVVDGQPWSNVFDFIWDLKVTPDGSHIGVAFQRDMEYGMAVDDQPWESAFENITGMALGPGGTSAAVVQVDAMAAADVDTFAGGLFSVAVDGKAGRNRFVNAWDICFDTDGKAQAFAVRYDRETYGVAVNGEAWDGRFQAVWRPMFCNGGGSSSSVSSASVAAPVRTGGRWYVYKDDNRFWTSGYENVWRLTGNDVNGDIAAIVALAFGRWSVALNDRPWSHTWDTMVRDVYFSKTGNSLVAVFKDQGAWGLAQDDRIWQDSWDKLFTPQISPDGSVVAVCAEKQGNYFTLVNDRVIAGPSQFMADPVIGPDNSRILVKGIDGGIYKREVITL